MKPLCREDETINEARKMTKEWLGRAPIEEGGILNIEKEKEMIGEQEIVYDEFVEEADMEDVENEDDDAAEELFYLCQLDKSLTPNSM